MLLKYFILDLKTIEVNKDTRICSFGIENMYANIPKIRGKVSKLSQMEVKQL
jgi:hypothetical protein